MQTSRPPKLVHDDKEGASEVVEDARDLQAQQSLPLPMLNQNVTRRMILFSLFISLAGWVFNFDLGYGGTVLQMPAYRRAFGRCAPRTDPITGVTAVVCSQTALQQGLVSLTLIFVALGGLVSGIVGSFFGRRGTIQAGAIIAGAGAAGMLGTSGNLTNYLVCKCIGGVGLGLLIAAAGVYGAECTVARYRGMLLALYNIGLGMGFSASSAVCWGSSSYVTSDLSWQIPIMCQIPLSVILSLGVLAFPESPRWLLTKGRDEAAKKSFAWLYAKDPDHPDILLQVADVQNHIQLERSGRQEIHWTEIYQGVNFRRTMVSGLIMVGLAITGSKFTGPYGAIFLAGVGITNPFLNTFIISLMMLAGSVGGPWLVEYGGRRFAMLVGYTIMMVCMLIIGIVGSTLGQTTSKARIILLVFLFLWSFVFGLFIGSSVWIAAPEQHSLRLRTYGQASTVWIYQVFGFASSFWAPYQINPQYGNMGMSVGYFYAGVTFAMLVLTYFLVPETTCLTLEQIADHYDSGRPAWKTSTRRNKRIASGLENANDSKN